jgi:hypothetical protein
VAGDWVVAGFSPCAAGPEAAARAPPNGAAADEPVPTAVATFGIEDTVPEVATVAYGIVCSGQ